MISFAHLALGLVLSAPPPVAVHHPIGTLHGFPSMSDTSGRVVADGELEQRVSADRVVVDIRWTFVDGRRVHERDEFAVGPELAQERFTWTEAKDGEEVRRFDVDFSTGRATSAIRNREGRLEQDHEKLDLPRGRAFTGYGAALAVSQLDLPPGGKTEITYVAFTSDPRTVKLQIRRERDPEPISVEGRNVPCDRFTLHPDLPFPLRLFAHPKDAHLWLTHSPPPALVRAQQNLVTKDDPIVVIDVTPRGPARARAAGRATPR